MTCSDVERDLDPYVDGELGGDAEAAVRAHLATCERCRRRVAERQALGQLVRSAPYFTAPDRLRARVASGATRSRTIRHLATLASAAALVLAVGGSVALVRSASARRAVLVDSVVDGHVRSLMGDHLFDVRSTDQHTVKPWFLGKIDFAPPVADLASIGFPLVGGRLDYLAGEPVAALVYQRQKHTINVFVSPAGGATAGGDEARTVRGFHVRHWTHNGMSFWAVSDLNDAELDDFVRALQQT